jgi:hypothetical protein
MGRFERAHPVSAPSAGLRVSRVVHRRVEAFADATAKIRFIHEAIRSCHESFTVPKSPG